MTTAASARAERERHRGMGAGLPNVPSMEECEARTEGSVHMRVPQTRSNVRRADCSLSAAVIRRGGAESHTRRWRDTAECVANWCTSPRRAAWSRSPEGRLDAPPPLRSRAVAPEMARPLRTDESPFGKLPRAAGMKG